MKLHFLIFTLLTVHSGKASNDILTSSSNKQSISSIERTRASEQKPPALSAGYFEGVYTESPASAAPTSMPSVPPGRHASASFMTSLGVGTAGVLACGLIFIVCCIGQIWKRVDWEKCCGEAVLAADLDGESDLYMGGYTVAHASSIEEGIDRRERAIDLGVIMVDIAAANRGFTGTFSRSPTSMPLMPDMAKIESNCEEGAQSMHNTAVDTKSFSCCEEKSGSPYSSSSSSSRLGGGVAVGSPGDGPLAEQSSGIRYYEDAEDDGGGINVPEASALPIENNGTRFRLDRSLSENTSNGCQRSVTTEGGGENRYCMDGTQNSSIKETVTSPPCTVRVSRTTSARIDPVSWLRRTTSAGRFSAEAINSGDGDGDADRDNPAPSVQPQIAELLPTVLFPSDVLEDI